MSRQAPYPIPPQIDVWHSPQVVKVPMHATRRGSSERRGKRERERERFDSRSFVHSGGREREGRMIGKATEWPIAPRK